MRSHGHRFLVVAALLCLLPAAMFAQARAGHALVARSVNSPPKPSGVTPRTPDGHPDLSGVWNGLGDNINGIPNQMANDGVSVDSENSSHDIPTGTPIATFPRNATH